MARKTIRYLAALTIMTAGAALAQNPTIDWYTLDGGGGKMSSVPPGFFELTGTIGQADASSFDTPMIGGGFELVGGFWPVAAVPTACACLGDFTGDNARAGSDIQGFVDCLTATGANCGCADLDGNATLDMIDVGLFVSDLLAGTPCP